MTGTADDPRAGRPALDPREVADAVASAAADTGVRPGRVRLVAATASTSSDLVTAVTVEPERWPDRSVLVADHQQGGRGRGGRRWSTPAGAALTVSYLLRPEVPAERLGWLPLVAGLAVVQAVGELCGVRAAVKWPNDVLVDHPGREVLPGWGTRRKLAGVLAEVVPTTEGPAVVLGIGVNVAQQVPELPVPSATSLGLVGARVDRTELLGVLTRRLLGLDRRWRAAAGPGLDGLAAECAAVSATLGEAVTVELPGGRAVEGTARRLAPDGALVVVDRTGREHTVLAGDVRLRSAPVI